jgi:glucose/arabinose dehydrogenase
MNRRSSLLHLWVLSCGLLWSGATASAAVAASISATNTTDWTVEVMTTDLFYPWDIKHAGDGLVITEASGNVVMIEGSQLRRYALQTSEPIVQEGGSGLLGMALDQNFPTSGVAYFYHTYRSRSGLTNKVIEARFDGRRWHETRTLLTAIPGHPLYNGGRIGIGPDDHLYVTTGWTEDGQLPQDLRSLAGKVLRLRRDGRVPADNPFPNSYVYSSGHRNPQGLAWDRAGALYVAEHGQTARDEINRIKPGANYGWPAITGSETRRGMEVPALHSGHETWAPSGIAFVGDTLLVAALAARGLYAWDPRGGTMRPIFTSGDRLRDLVQVEADIFVVTTNRSPRASGATADRLLKLTPREKHTLNQ